MDNPQMIYSRGTNIYSYNLVLFLNKSHLLYLVSYPIVGLMLGSKLSSTNLHTILDLPTPVS